MDRHEWWDEAVLAGESAHSSKTWEMPPPLTWERHRSSCILRLLAVLLLKSGADGTAFGSKVLCSTLASYTGRCH